MAVLIDWRLLVESDWWSLLVLVCFVTFFWLVFLAVRGPIDRVLDWLFGKEKDVEVEKKC